MNSLRETGATILALIKGQQVFRTAAISVVLLLAAERGTAQSVPTPVEVSGVAGYAGFVEDGLAWGIIGGTLRVPLTERLSVGPQLLYLVRPRGILFVTANLTWDLDSRSVVVPYLAADAGFRWHHARFGSHSTIKSTASAGGGVRMWTSTRTSLAAEVRLVGLWDDLHFRVVASVGYRFGRQ